MSELLVINARIVDADGSRPGLQQILIRDGLIVAVGADVTKEASLGVAVFDARGLYVAPGLIDMHVHLREPGQSAKETIASGTAAAVAGGFTAIVCMPNTSPVVDSPSVVKWVQDRAQQHARCRVLIAGALTVGLADDEMAPIGSLAESGVVAVTDDGHCVQNYELMRRALQYAAMFGLPVLDHCEQYDLSADGVMHEGLHSLILGLQGIPPEAEEVIVARDILLAGKIGCHVHCQHISSRGSVELLRTARERGIRVSGEVTPHHFTLTDAAVAGSEVFWEEDGRDMLARFDDVGLPTWSAYDTRTKVNPPLRSREDREAIIEALRDGTIEVIASDHAPHTHDDKEVEFDYAPFGMIGLETAFALALDRLYHRGILTLPELIAKFTVGPARVLGLEKMGRVMPGFVGDLTVFDPDRWWIYRAERGYSKAKNTIFDGWKLHGKALATIVGGKIAWHDEQFCL